jgi:hypothetical protein
MDVVGILVGDSYLKNFWANYHKKLFKIRKSPSLVKSSGFVEK